MDGGQGSTPPVLKGDSIGQTSYRKSRGHEWRRFALPILTYGLLGLMLTWPMAVHLASHVPGDGIDDPSLAWNLWWARHAFLDQFQNPFKVAWQFWPVGINQAFYTLTLLNGLLGIPLQLAFGLIPTYNLLLLSSFAIGGFGAYLLCLDVLGAVDREKARRGDKKSRSWSLIFSLAAFVGGGLYAFASSKMFYAALGQGNIASTQWIPFAALYLLRAARRDGRSSDAAMAALFMVLQAYAELTYASFLLVFAALVALWGLLRNLAKPWSLIARFLLIGLFFTIGITPFLANMLPDLRAEGDFLASGGGFSDQFSADLVGYALPTQLHPVVGDVIRGAANDSAPRADGSHFPVDKGQQIYVGYVALVLALIGLWRGRRSAEAWLWAGAALVFFTLTLGPSLRVAGYDQGIPLPFAWISRLPFFEANRYPSRYSVMLLLCLAPLVALGLRISTRPRPIRSSEDPRLRVSPASNPRSAIRNPQLLCWSIFIVVFGALLFEHLSVPLPLSDLRVPTLYERVAVEPGDFALLEIPLGWRNGARVAGKADTVIMQQLWNQTTHDKRVLGGNTSRNPEFKFQYFSENPTLALLIALTNAADLPQHTALREALAAREITDSDRAHARDLAALLRIRYVMVHRDKIPPDTESALRALLPLELVDEADTLALYRVADDLAVPQSFRLGDETSRVVLAEGWSPPSLEPGVYAERPEVRLLLPVPPERTKLRLQGRSLAPNQEVSLAVNGREIASGLMPDQLGWLTLDVPAAPERPPLSDVRLRFSKLVPVDKLQGGPWTVGTTDAESPTSVLVRSAGEETGDFARIYLNGVNLSPGERGYNLVALDPRDGKILASEAFDTHADPAASSRLWAWVEGLPQGSIVAGAVRDEASMNLSEEALTALSSLGVAADLRGHFRWGHAFIGAKGAPAGSAVESVDGIRPAQVSVGLPVSAPQVAAWVGDVALGD